MALGHVPRRFFGDLVHGRLNIELGRVGLGLRVVIPDHQTSLPILRYYRRMTDSRDLRVEVQGANIVVSLPGTAYTVTYKKWTDLQHLVLTYSSSDTDVSASIVSKFRARAFEAAVDRARTLGWII